MTFLKSLGLVFPLYIAGVTSIIAGVWQASEPWGKAVLGVAFLLTAVLIVRMRR